VLKKYQKGIRVKNLSENLLGVGKSKNFGQKTAKKSRKFSWFRL